MKTLLTNQIILSLVIISLIFNISIYGQDNCSKDTANTSVIQDINTGFNDGIKLLKSPEGFTSKDWIYLGGITGVTAGSFLIDKTIRNSVADNHSKTMNDITKIGEYYGTAQYMIILSGAAYLTGKLIKNKDISETGRMLLETLAYAGVNHNDPESRTGKSKALFR